MDEIEVLALFGGPLGGMETGSKAAKLAELELQVRGCLARYREAAKAHRENGHYSNQGKRVRVQNAAADSLGELDRIRSAADFRGVADLIAQLRASIANPKVVDVRDAAAKAESLWIRQFLLDNADVDRVGLLFGAVESGDAATLAAFVDAPKWLRLIPDGVLEEALKSWGRRHSPEYTATLEQLGRASQHLENSLAIARRTIASDAGLAAGDPVAELADESTDAATVSALIDEIGIS